MVPLRVSGPFHSPLLYGAGEQLQKELEKISFNKIRIPYIANLTAEYVTDSKEIPELLRKQVYSPVRFEQTLRKLITDGFDTFIEIGPGRTLTGFVKRRQRKCSVKESPVSILKGRRFITAYHRIVRRASCRK